MSRSPTSCSATKPSGLKVSDLEIRDELRVAAVQRRNVVYVARSDFELLPGDLVVAATKPSARGKVRRYLRAAQQDGG